MALVTKTTAMVHKWFISGSWVVRNPTSLARALVYGQRGHFSLSCANISHYAEYAEYAEHAIRTESTESTFALDHYACGELPCRFTASPAQVTGWYSVWLNGAELRSFKGCSQYQCFPHSMLVLLLVASLFPLCLGCFTVSLVWHACLGCIPR